MFDILAHPDLVKMWGPTRPRPEGDLRRFYDRAMEAIADSGIAVEVSTGGPAQAGRREIYPDRAFLEMVVDAGNPIALSSDAHTPDQLGFRYERRACELLADVGVTELCVFDRRDAPPGADRPRVSVTTGIGWDVHQLAEGRRLVLGGVADRARPRPARALRRRRADPRGDGRAARRRRARRHRRRTSRTPTALRGRGLARAPAPRRRRCWASARSSTSTRRSLMERPKLAPHKAGDPRCARRRDRRAPDRVNVKATTGERMGFVGREEGVAALAVATLSRPSRLRRMAAVYALNLFDLAPNDDYRAYSRALARRGRQARRERRRARAARRRRGGRGHRAAPGHGARGVAVARGVRRVRRTTPTHADLHPLRENGTERYLWWLYDRLEDLRPLLPSPSDLGQRREPEARVAVAARAARSRSAGRPGRRGTRARARCPARSPASQAARVVDHPRLERAGAAGTGDEPEHPALLRPVGERGRRDAPVAAGGRADRADLVAVACPR